LEEVTKDEYIGGTPFLKKGHPLCFVQLATCTTGITMMMNQFNIFSCSSFKSFPSYNNLYAMRKSSGQGRVSFQ